LGTRLYWSVIGACTGTQLPAELYAPLSCPNMADPLLLYTIPNPPRITVFGSGDQAKPKRGPRLSLLAGYSVRLAGLGALKSMVANWLCRSRIHPEMSHRRPKLSVRFERTRNSSWAKAA